MGQQISANDQDYAHYSGAFISDAMLMAKIDFMLRSGLIEEGDIKVMVKAIRYYLDLKRKAYFSSLGSDIFSKLSFIQGDTRRVLRWKV
jgi:uncharacterized protein (UPF0303 family)